jgi:DNA-binding response OmpR family regulator
MATILVVDDELGIRALLSEILADEGHTVELAENAAQARQVRESLRPDLVLLDIWMPDVDGGTLLKEWSAGGQLTMPVIMMSGHGTIDTAVEATKHGASAFLEKPITLQKLLRAVEQALVKPAQRLAALWPGPPSARSAGCLREKLLRISPGQRRRLNDPRGRKDRPGAHAPLSQTETAGRGLVAQQTRRRLKRAVYNHGFPKAW